MSDDMLSQEEIEALLRGETLDDKIEEMASNSKTNSNEKLVVEDYLTEMERDALGEIGNISFGSSATALSSLLGQKVEITTPVVSLINRNNLEEEFPHPYVAVSVEYTTGISGVNLLVIKQSDAAIIADLMLGGDGRNPNPDLGEIQLSAVQEAMNQMMGSAATSMSTMFNKKVDISPPSLALLNIKENEGEENIPDDEILVRVSFRLLIGDLVDSTIMELLPLDLSKKLVKSLFGENADANQPEAQPHAQAEPKQLTASPMQQSTTSQLEQPIQQANQPVYQQQAATTHEIPSFTTYSQPKPQPVNVQQAQFATFEQPKMTEAEARNLNMLLDIPLQVTVELGRTKHSVKEILQLASGSIIELDRLAGEPVDILVNNRLIAKGEVVVIDENFGVRITDIISQKERINNLR
ncbi:MULTISPECIES: flagellar motor switch phosphatase FliY [Ureibacillus]|jgi:flagellar motor switch protein FliN|uniref:Flagellar motor switch protein FliN/FliY n=1 Tax=Ureibacillus thermosphaericus TaxID=51173 RepID=A0A840PYD6_URETH|nr:flagellar motor switch phosphatase FliY [Ureibacillus thermosphaericus]MBB5147866.1 flagellar motor switch protein FliN/FliY [Ureibacillus thermosphaericus]NKZ30332.1 flagellar motor switch phosphatase FliY [Ureibacillus thermosphaericus]